MTSSLFSRTEIRHDLTVILIITDCTPDDEGDYTIKLTNEKGEASCTAEVIIHLEAPVFIEPLSDVVCNVKDTATLQCKFTGIPKPTIIWKANDLPIKDGPKYHITTDNENAILSISEVGLDESEMVFLCKAENIVGEDTTSTQLTVQGLFIALRAAVVVNALTCYMSYTSMLITQSALHSSNQTLSHLLYTGYAALLIY